MAGVRTTPRNDAVMHLRLPAALLADIRRLAAANHRSANAEVRHHVIEANRRA